MSMENELKTPFLWDISQEIAECVDLERWAVDNTVNLLDQDNTVPFIARYRKEKTNNMEADKIREVKDKYEELKSVRNKVKTAMKAVEKLGKLTNQLSRSFRSSKTLAEVEHLYAQFKQGSKGTLAERARELGLEALAENVLDNKSTNLKSAVQSGKKGVSTLAEVETGLQHIIADILSKDKETMDAVRDIYKNRYIAIETSKKVVKKKETPDTEEKNSKFQQYFSYSCPLRQIQPHQVMAINRGENLKVLTIKFNIPETVKHNFRNFCARRWIKKGSDNYVRGLIERSVDDAHKRLIEPLMIRQYRSDLTKTAEKASIDVFAKNLKRLLLTPPVRGKVVLGVDPGFKHGCKFAVTSPTGSVLDTGIAYLHTHGSMKQTETNKIKNLLLKYRCETVAIGNGTACRETEQFFSSHISQKTFCPLHVEYCIVNEAGASVYSASVEAKQELPDLDVSLRGAVSIARRLQDPMGELVKIEPKHIGVGMYQHDCPESQLKTSLDSVLEECVSFTGVDINVCSEFLLRRIAGLSASKAKKVIEFREANKGFLCREELKKIKGLGPKSFEQCVGFVRVLPETRRHGGAEDTDSLKSDLEPTSGQSKKRKSTKATSSSKSKKAKVDAASPKPDMLDTTSIHPESYDTAERVLGRLKLQKEDIGQEHFVKEVKARISMQNMDELASDLDVGVPTLTLIVTSLQQKIGHDIREEFEKPLFKQDILSFQNLKTGLTLTGKVTNVTHFGAFVDVGVGKDGLVPSRYIQPRLLNGRHELGIGDKIEVKVLSLDIDRKRLALQLLQLL